MEQRFYRNDVTPDSRSEMSRQADRKQRLQTVAPGRIRVLQYEHFLTADVRHRQRPNTAPMPARLAAPISLRYMSSERSRAATTSGASRGGGAARALPFGTGKSSDRSATWMDWRADGAGRRAGLVDNS